MNDRQAILGYLCGEYDEAAQRKFEERLFTEEGFFHEVEAVEDDWIDAYVRGELDPAEATRFEQRYLTSPERRRRVAFARALRRAAGAPATGSAVAKRTWLATAAAVVVALGVWAARRVQTPPPPAAAWPSSPAPTPTTTPPSSSAATPPTFSVTVLPEATRGLAPTSVVRVPPSVEEVVVRAVLPGGRPQGPVRARLSTVEGQTLWGSDRNLTVESGADPPIVVVRIPAARVPSGDHLLSLHDEGSEIAAYFLAVRR